MKSESEILKDYRIVDFYKRDNLTKDRRAGAKIGEYMAVTYAEKDMRDHYVVVRLHDGQNVLDTKFNNLEDALAMAHLINEAFDEYLPLWENYPNADIITLAQWSISNGQSIVEIVKSLPPVVSTEQFNTAFAAIR